MEVMKTGRPAARPLIVAIVIAATLLWLVQSIQAQAAFPPLAGDSSLVRVPDSADIRARLWAQVLAAQPDTVMALRARVVTNPWGSWRISIDRGLNAFYVSIIPARQASVTAGGGGTLSYPQYGQGTWIIKRSNATGDFVQAKIFLRSDPGTFARIYPFGGRSRMDIVAYGGVLYRQVILPLSIEDTLRSPLSRIMKLTADVVDWSLFSPDPALHAGTRALAASIRQWLPVLRYGDDGALDADGRPVYIASLLPQGPNPGLNCSGFVKWITDGILHPFTGSWLSVKALKERMTDWQIGRAHV